MEAFMKKVARMLPLLVILITTGVMAQTQEPPAPGTKALRPV